MPANAYHHITFRFAAIKFSLHHSQPCNTIDFYNRADLARILYELSSHSPTPCGPLCNARAHKKRSRYYPLCTARARWHSSRLSVYLTTKTVYGTPKLCAPISPSPGVLAARLLALPTSISSAATELMACDIPEEKAKVSGMD
ncbi:hypothetical protein ACTXT7_001696 [Hymenolepis weldensis]